MGEADPEALGARLGAGDVAGVVGLLAGLDEGARRELAPVAWAAHRESRGARLWERPALVAALAGTASGEELAARRWPLYARQEDLERVLLERRPPWIRDWMEFELPRRPRLWRFFLGLAQAGCFEPGTSEA